MSRRDARATQPTWHPVLAAILVCLSGWLVYRGALAFFFAQDDFIGLARARGLLPPLTGLWRILPGRVYFEVMAPLAGLDAFPYRLVSLLAHLATALLLFVLLRRRVSAAAAWIGATFFAVHPALFTALYSVSGIGEILSAGFALAALLLAERDGRARWLALPLFAASLLCKESTLLLPVAALLLAARPDAPTRRSRSLVAALALTAAAYVIYFALAVHGTQFMGPDTAGRADAPYAMGFDATLLWNLLTYIGWTVNFLLPTVRGVADVIERSVTPAAVIGLAAWAAGLLWRPLRARGWLAGGLVALCFLLPVLPLPNHTYHYYLYAPLIGASLCVAALADTLFARGAAREARGGSPPAAPPWALALAAALAIALTANGALLVRKIETFPFSHPLLRADPTVDRALIAGRVRDDLAGVALPEHVQLLFWSPPAIALERAEGRDTTVESYWERNVREALVDGLAVRTMFPRVGGVRFVREFQPTGRDTLWAVYTVDGRLLVADGAAVDTLMRRAARP